MFTMLGNLDSISRKGERMNTIRYPTNRYPVLVPVFLSLCFAVVNAASGNAEVKKMYPSPDGPVFDLPAPVLKGKLSLEETLNGRESVRSFSTRPLTKKELSQLLWAMQGTTRSWGARTAPSAGALFPLEIYVAFKEGVFHYSPREHRLVRVSEKDLRDILARAALGQGCVREAPAVFVISGVYERTARKYGNRAERYVKMEAGHAGQNLLLQAAALGLGAVPVGAFEDEQVKQALHLPPDHEPLYLIPVGGKK
jgi:SagB-type dehydrogenase family enzyme